MISKGYGQSIYSRNGVMEMALQWKIDDHLFELILKLNSLSLCTFEISKHNALIVFID